MKKYSKIISYFIFLIFILSLLPFIVQAQGQPLDPPDPCSDPTQYCPIDGGLGFLIAAGIGYGVKKARDSRKKIYKMPNLPA